MFCLTTRLGLGQIRPATTNNNNKTFDIHWVVDVKPAHLGYKSVQIISGCPAVAVTGKRPKQRIAWVREPRTSLISIDKRSREF